MKNIYKNSVGRGDSSHFPHIYNSTKTGRAGIVCSSVLSDGSAPYDLHAQWVPLAGLLLKNSYFRKTGEGPSLHFRGDSSQALGWRLAFDSSDSSREASPQKRYVRLLACARRRPIVIISHIYMLIEAMYENIQM